MTQEVTEIKKPIKINYKPFEYEDDNLYHEELNKITDDTFANAATTKTIKNIREVLVKTLKKKYKITDKEKLTNIANELLKIHGLNEEKFDFIKSFSTFMAEKLNDVSIDDNSNKNEKSIKGLLKDCELSADKIIGYDMLYRTMKELYGQEEAKFLSGEMYDFSLGLADSSNILLPYCWALDASKLVTSGRNFGVLPSKPCKSVASYISALCETIHQMASHLAGAIAIGSFFLDITHLMIYKQRISLKDLREDKRIRKQLENEFQQFVHSVNFLSRNGSESPFTNVSIFDKEKLAALIDDDNYGWYFPKNTKVLVDNDLGGDDYKLTEEEYKKFIIDYIFETQKVFIEFFDKGDPMNNGLQYRFPVTTINLSKHKNQETGEYYIEKDNELLNYITKKDIARYNIFTSEGTKVASCCRLISDKDMLDLASSVNSFGGSSISLGSHRVVTVNLARLAYEATSYNDYLKRLYERTESAAKVLKAHRVLLKKLNNMGMHPFLKNYWINLSRMFSTFGMMGVVEAEKILTEKFGKMDFDYIGEILTTYNTFCKEMGDKYGFIWNIEEIPGESFAVRLASSDSLIFGNPFNLDPLYSNQFVPLWKDATIYEKMEADGKYNRLLTGGGIVHIQINSDVTSTQAKAIINYAVKCGCEHFALNAVYTKCEDCGEVVKDKTHHCPKCGSKNVTNFTRVVGFFVPVSSWNKVRRTWEFDRRTFVDLNGIDKKGDEQNDDSSK